MNVLTVTPTESSPKFEELGAVHLAGVSGPCKVYLHGSFLLIRGTEQSFILWDYYRGRIVRLEPSTPPSIIDVSSQVLRGTW
jgi:hypothetical protein